MDTLYKYAGWNQEPEPPTKFEQNCAKVNNNLDRLKNFFETHDINSIIINHSDKIIGSALLVIQVSSRFWTSAFGFIAGNALGWGLKHFDVQIPPQLMEIAEKIKAIWAHQGIRISTYVAALILLYASPDATSFFTSLGAGACTYSALSRRLFENKEL